MPEHDECEYCINVENGVVRSPPLLRSDAFALYVRLQAQGQFPSMCENRNGKCRVCYAEGRAVEG